MLRVFQRKPQQQAIEPPKLEPVTFDMRTLTELATRVRNGDVSESTLLALQGAFERKLEREALNGSMNNLESLKGQRDGVRRLIQEILKAR